MLPELFQAEENKTMLVPETERGLRAMLLRKTEL